MSRRAACVAALVLLVSACGGDGADRSEPTAGPSLTVAVAVPPSTTSSAPPSTAATVTASTADTVTSSVAAGNDASAVPATPFAPTSIWRRTVDPSAVLVSVDDVLGRDANRITSAFVDVVTLCSVDPAAPLVNVELDAGWTLPDRATSSGQVLYRRHLADDSCTDVSWNPNGNALFVLYDPSTGTADLGVGGWRTPGGPLLEHAPDGRDAHGLDVGGDGLVGYGRASGLPALGGLIRPGELEHGIDHALAINLPVGVLSSAQHFVWPARSADGAADATYQGTNPALAMGSLLAIPPSVDLLRLPWHTSQGRVLAAAAQRYGMYVVDALGAPHQVQLGISSDAARTDLGLRFDATTGQPSFDAAVIDGNGLVVDVALIMSLVQVVPQVPG